MEKRYRNKIIIKETALRAADLGSIPGFSADLFPSRVTPVTTDVKGSVLGLVGPVSVYSLYCDCARRKV